MVRTQAILVLALLLLAGCAETDSVCVGVAFPLTGEAASFGEGGRAGIELALQEINDGGGIDGVPVEAVYEDTKCDSSTGATAFSRLATTDVRAIIGPVCSSAASGSLPVAQQQGIPVILTGASAPDLTAIGEYIFRIYPSDSFLGVFLSEHVYRELSAERIAVLYVQNDWGEGVRDRLVESFEGQVVFDQAVAAEERDYRTLILRMQEQDPDVVVALLQPAGGISFVKQLRQSGSELLVIGGDHFDAEEVREEPVMQGVSYVLADVGTTETFSSEIETLSGKEPNLVTPLAYDAMMMLAEVMRTDGTGRETIRDALSDVSYEGISSPSISFDPQGDLETPVYEVKTIE